LKKKKKFSETQHLVETLNVGLTITPPH